MTNASFTFNGVRKDFIFCEDDGREQSVFAPLTRNLLTFPGMPGALLESTETQIRVIRQQVFYYGLKGQDLRKLEEEMAAWLVTDKAVPLIFDDESDRVYYAVIDGSFNIEESLKIGEGTITFICPDPFKYGSLKEALLPVDIANLAYNGTAETYPFFKGTVKASITYLDIVTEKGYMRIGEPVTVEETIVQPNEKILVDEMASLVGWTSGSTIDGGVVTGTMETNGSEFIVNNFGTGSNWHGPAVKKSLSEPLQDFMVEFVVSIYSDSRSQTGRLELYLLDINGEVIAKLAMKDVTQGDLKNVVEVRVGSASNGKFILTGAPAKYKEWSSFFGMVRLEREGNVFKAYATKIEGNNHVSTLVSQPITVEQINALAAVQVHIGQQGTIQPASMKIHKLNVFKRNLVSGQVIPYIANEGDVIEIDHQKNDIRINGESRKDLKDFGASFFSLMPGNNLIEYAPAAAVDMEIEWRERYK